MKLLLKSILFSTGLCGIFIAFTYGLTRFVMYLEQFGIVYPIGLLLTLIWIGIMVAYYLGHKNRY